MMWKRAIALAVIAIGFGGTALAQELPPGKWWRRPEVAKKIALTEEQQRKLDVISRDAVNDLIDARAAVEKAAIALRNELDQPELTRENVRKLGARLQEARARLFERELMMLVDMRGALDEQQWTQLRTAMERRPERAERPRVAPRPPGTPMAPRGQRPMAPPPDERRP